MIHFSEKLFTSMEQLIPLTVFLVFHWHFVRQELRFKMILKNRCLILVDSHRSPDTTPYKYINISIELTLSSFTFYYDS